MLLRHTFIVDYIGTYQYLLAYIIFHLHIYALRHTDVPSVVPFAFDRREWCDANTTSLHICRVNHHVVISL